MPNATYLERLANYGIDYAHPGGLRLTKELLLRENIRPDMILLDIGCGTGQTSAYIAKKYTCTVVATDINPTMIEKSKKTFLAENLNIYLIQADAMRLPFPGNSFDFILSESVTVFTRINQALREYYRTLKPDGIFLAIEATALSPLSVREAEQIRDILDISYVPSPEEWRQYFQKNRFSRVETLAVSPMISSGTFPPGFNHVFSDFIKIIRNNRKLGYGVYRCQI